MKHKREWTVFPGRLGKKKIMKEVMFKLPRCFLVEIPVFLELLPNQLLNWCSFWALHKQIWVSSFEQRIKLYHILKMESLLLHGNHPDVWLWALPKISCDFSTCLLTGIMNSVPGKENSSLYTIQKFRGCLEMSD